MCVCVFLCFCFTCCLLKDQERIQPSHLWKIAPRKIKNLSIYATLNFYNPLLDSLVSISIQPMVKKINLRDSEFPFHSKPSYVFFFATFLVSSSYHIFGRIPPIFFITRMFCFYPKNRYSIGKKNMQQLIPTFSNFNAAQTFPLGPRSRYDSHQSRSTEFLHPTGQWLPVQEKQQCCWRTWKRVRVMKVTLGFAYLTLWL